MNDGSGMPMDQSPSDLCPRCGRSQEEDAARDERPKVVASFLRSQQVSPDDWDSWRQTMICDDTTTIGEIREWVGTMMPKLHIWLDEFDK